LGLVVNFLSHPVVNGFTNAAALIIATSQLSKIFGVYVDKAPHHYETILRIFVSAYHYLHWPTLAMAAVAFATMIGLKRINKRIPQVLIAVVITTVVSWVIGFQNDETVNINQLRSEEVTNLVKKFNDAVHTRGILETQRSEDKKAWERIESQGRETCASCHSGREIDSIGSSVENAALGKTIPETKINTLVLHDLAGLVDQHIKHIKKAISIHRGELRSMLLERATASNGESFFYLKGSAPIDAQVEAGTWRIAVGYNPLNPDSLKITSGGAVVAQIPEGLPSFRKPAIDWDIVLDLAAAAI
ncbi:MAG: SulP family inorganic anion transporter, partial [Proteobacteria bacterium]|nr:SulP family inorganic anion transporter [Pseudomonadota bacterium]